MSTKIGFVADTELRLRLYVFTCSLFTMVLVRPRLLNLSSWILRAVVAAIVELLD